MARMIAPQGMNSLSVKDARGREKVLRRSKDGTFHVNNPQLVQKLKEEGLGIAGVAPAGMKATGFPCQCGFASLFVVCSKCGRDNGKSEA